MLPVLLLGLILNGPQAAAALVKGSGVEGEVVYSDHLHKVHDNLANSMLVYLVTAGMDQYSTSYCIAKNPRCFEANKLGFNSEARTGLKLMGLGVIGWGDYTLRRKGSHKTANILRYGTLALMAGVVTSNFIQAHR